MDRNTKTVALEDPESVALRKESVDRNFASSEEVFFQAVALRKESVDRNSSSVATLAVLAIVALRKESVDRNNNIFRNFLN